MEKSQAKLDWTYLPANATSQSLWATLHDAEICDVRSDLGKRAVSLEIDSAHLRSFHRLGEASCFLLTFQEVASARVCVFVEGTDVPNLQGKTYEEQVRMTEEYQAHGREESLGWGDFVAAFSTSYFDISSAEVAQSENAIAMQLQGTLIGDEAEDRYVSLFLAATRLEIELSEGAELTLEAFCKLGEDYWDAWEAKSNPSVL